MVSKDLKDLKVAIVHDWIYGGGAELVVEQLHKLFPDAPIYCTFATPEWRERLNGKVVTGILGRWPFNKIHRLTGVLRIFWYGSLNFKDYDLVISSSGAEAKSVKTPASTLHINYCHAPTHYYWSRYDQYMKNPGFGALNPIGRFFLRLLLKPLRKWDFKAARRPDVMIANSTHIQQEIEKYYKRDSTVIFPPVYIERFTKPSNHNLERSGFIIAGRQTPYKRFDLAIEACSQLNKPLVVVGGGPDHERLRKLAGKNVTFLGKAADEVLEEKLASASALIFPGLDDFGITPVEAMASGTPVIAFRAGGALDYIKPGKTGEFFDEQTTSSLTDAIKSFDSKKYNHEEIRSFAEQFSKEAFRRNMTEFITKSLKEHDN